MSRKEFNLTQEEAEMINKNLLLYGLKLEESDNYPLFTTFNTNTAKSISKSKFDFDSKTKFQDVNSKLKYFFKKIMTNDDANLLYYRNNIVEPSLLQVEKNIGLDKYTSLNDMFNEIKRIYQYYLEFYQKNHDIIAKITRLYDYSENLMKYLEQNYITNNYNLNHQNKMFFRNLSIPNSNAMTEEEVLILSKNINKLTSEHLIGVVKLLSENYSIDKSKKYFEFNIKTLPIKKARELEAYVKFCLNEAYY